MDGSVRIGSRVLNYALYGPPDGLPVVSLGGSPSTRWKRPSVVEAIAAAGLRMVIPDRPGYGGSSRQPGRTVADPRRDRSIWLAARDGDALRPGLAESFAGIMASVEAGGPEFPPDPHHPAPPAPPARDDPEAMARLKATFVTSHDGLVDDYVAFATPWGFDLADVRVPTSIWFGTADERAGKHAAFLIEAMPQAESVQYVGAHAPPIAAYREILGWLRGATNAAGAGR